MTAVQNVKHWLEEDWNEDVRGRVVEVPEPEFSYENQDTQARLQYNDHIFVQDGGVQSIEPTDVNYTAERVTTLVNIDIRSTDKNRPSVTGAVDGPGRTRMFGYIDDESLESESYGGLVGEVRRILQQYRKGEGSFDKVNVTEVNDISGQSGTHKYRVIITLQLETIASRIEGQYVD